MKKEFIKVSSILEILNNGGEILFISVNRETPTNSTNVKGKMKSLKAYGVASPLILIPASFAKDEGLILVDWKLSVVTDEERIKKAFVILDGNNRYKAYLAIKEEKAKADANGKEYDEGKGLDDIPCVIQENKPEMGVLNTLIEMNTTSVTWKGGDYATTAAKLYPDNEVLQFVKEMLAKKMSMSTISLILCFGKDLKPVTLANMVKTGKLEGDYDLERAKRVINTFVSAGFEQKIINKRYLIEFVQKKADKLDAVLKAFSELTKDEVIYISENLGKSADVFEAVKEKMLG